MAEYVLWQLKNDHLGAGVEMVQMATLPNMEPANVEQWMRTRRLCQSKLADCHGSEGQGL